MGYMICNPDWYYLINEYKESGLPSSRVLYLQVHCKVQYLPDTEVVLSEPRTWMED